MRLRNWLVRWGWLALPAVLLGAGAVVSIYAPAHARASGAFPQDIYVWQRNWDGRVGRAIETHGPEFSTLVALGAEMTFEGTAPRVTMVKVGWENLASLTNHARVGLAIRIGTYRGDFSASQPASALLESIARLLLQYAHTHDVAIAELQLDFDCPESRLSEYTKWVRQIKAACNSTAVVITALPSWLKHAEFAELARSADGFVLQVHSVDRPGIASEQWTLCDPIAARVAVERAGRLGVPFRVALPTYGYTLAYDINDQFLGLSAEGPAKIWPAGTQFREIRADAAQMAKLVRGWVADRPASLAGVIWYRMPVEEDHLNWRFETLAAAMNGAAPIASLRAEVHRNTPGLAEVDLVNDGDADFVDPVEVVTEWDGLAPRASDAVGGFERTSAGDGRMILRAPASAAPGPGQHKLVAWMRFESDKEVRADVVAK